MSFLISGIRGLVKCASNIQRTKWTPTSFLRADKALCVQQQWLVSLRCLTLPPEKEIGRKRRGYFQPSAWKRLHLHSLEIALASKSGRRRLLNRTLKGCHDLTVHDSLLSVKPRYAKTKKELKQEKMVPKALRGRHCA